MQKLQVAFRILGQFKKDIKQGEILFRYAKKEAFPEGQETPPAGVFNDPELSCDWYKFQLFPENSFHIEQGREIIIEIEISNELREPKNPNSSKGEVVKEWAQLIFHDPVSKLYEKVEENNYSHSLIKGKKKKAITDILIKNSRIKNIEKLNK